MYRRLLVTVAFVGATVAATWAAERATFVLTDGSRKSGAVVFHGGLNENIIAGHLNLGNDAGGPEFTIPVEQVVVIDFAGGQPSAAEKAAVPDDASQLLVLRNGETLKGHLVNLISGETLVWQPPTETEKRFPIRDVRRVYMNSRLAWNAYLGEDPPTRSQNAAAASGAASGDSIRVQATTPWTDTGITVRRGEPITFEASGSVNLGPGLAAEPDGRPGMRGNYQLPNALGGALIARIGNSKPFLVGTSGRPFTFPVAGRLYLGVNDDNYSDNSGAFTVKVNAGSSAASAGAGGGAGSFEVPANSQWTDTGMTVRRGERLYFTASGTVSLGPGLSAEPDGRPGMRGSYQLPTALGGALIGRIGNGQPFLIGSSGQPFPIPANGRLFLGVNDDNFADNSGAFTIRIERQ